jgi:hypothetical protein
VYSYSISSSNRGVCIVVLRTDVVIQVSSTVLLAGYGYQGIDNILSLNLLLCVGYGIKR